VSRPAAIGGLIAGPSFSFWLAESRASSAAGSDRDDRFAAIADSSPSGARTVWGASKWPGASGGLKVTVRVTRRPGPLKSDAPAGYGANGISLTARDNPQTEPESAGFQRRCQSSTVLGHLQGPSHTRRMPCSGCHGKGKRAFEKPTPELQPAADALASKGAMPHKQADALQAGERRSEARTAQGVSLDRAACSTRPHGVGLVWHGDVVRMADG
jgi:hypothetical protein